MKLDPGNALTPVGIQSVVFLQEAKVPLDFPLHLMETVLFWADPADLSSQSIDIRLRILPDDFVSHANTLECTCLPMTPVQETPEAYQTGVGDLFVRVSQLGPEMGNSPRVLSGLSVLWSYPSSPSLGVVVPRARS